MTDIWSTIAAERGALVSDLSGLNDAQWETPSLCAQWNVREVVAHIAATADTGVGGFLKGFVGNGFNFDKYVNGGIAAHLGDSPAETLSTLKALQSSTKSPPGPKASWLGEVLIHAEDVRRPLGISHDYPIEAVRQVADFYKNSNAIIGSKSRISGLSLRATDDNWTHGTGPVVEGPLLSLLMAMTGRKAPVADLSGDGVETLRGRD